MFCNVQEWLQKFDLVGTTERGNIWDPFATNGLHMLTELQMFVHRQRYQDWMSKFEQWWQHFHNCWSQFKYAQIMDEYLEFGQKKKRKYMKDTNRNLFIVLLFSVLYGKIISTNNIKWTTCTLKVWRVGQKS